MRTGAAAEGSSAKDDMSSRATRALGLGAYLVLAIFAFLAAVSTIMSYYVFAAFPALIISLAMAWRYRRGHASRTTFFIGTAALCFMVSLLVWPYDIPSPPAPFWIRHELVRRLETARTSADRDQIVGSLGLHLPFADGSWLAIVYDDWHTWPTWSLAIGCDSDGNWYTSSEHYCGQLAMLDPKRNPDVRLSRRAARLARLRSARGLAEARAVLLQGGFGRMKR